MTAAPDPRLRDQLAEALAEKFTSPHGSRNPDWDWEKPDGPDNLYHLPVAMAERVESSPYIVFTDLDGCRSMRMPSCTELADVLIAAVQVAASQREAEAWTRCGEVVGDLAAQRVSLMLRDHALEQMRDEFFARAAALSQPAELDL